MTFAMVAMGTVAAVGVGLSAAGAAGAFNGKVDPMGATPEEQQAMAAEQQAQAQANHVQQKSVALDLAEKEARVGKLHAETAKASAAADAQMREREEEQQLKLLTEQVSALAEIVGNIGARLQ